MTSFLKINLVLIAILIASSGCAFSGGEVRDIEELGPALLRLTSAANGVAERPEVYGFQPDSSGEECLRLATEDDSSLLSNFDGYHVEAKCGGGQAVVLVCDSNSSYVLMEDVGCSDSLDYRFVGGEKLACEFSLNVEEICPK